jgi:3-oxoacyl-[acyl-carrier protein] reductase
MAGEETERGAMGAPADRVALITGGARGIGRATGVSLGRDGWRVAFCYRRSAEAAEETRAAIEAAGGAALAVRADVADPAAAEALVGAVLARWGRVDALVNCAGPFRRVALLDETPEGWREVFDANLHAVFYLSRLVAPGMIARGWGRIIVFGLASADRPGAHKNLTAYAAAKLGALVLARSLAEVLAPHGVTVNAVLPGIVDSGGRPAAELLAMRSRIPAGRVGHVRDAVAAVRFLLADDARYVTGTSIHVSGGWGL